MDPEGSSSRYPLRWGWIAVITGLDGGPWARATEASAVCGLPAATLKRFAERGIISSINWGERKHATYNKDELAVLVEKFGHAAPMWMVKSWIDLQLY